MAIDIKTLAAANLAVQFALMIVLLKAVLLARERKLKKHCTTMRLATSVQFLAIIGIMLPSLYGYIEHASIGHIFRAEIYVHHLIGLSLLLIWVYINLVFLRIVKKPIVRLRTMMLTALTLWVTSFILGLHIYVVAYL